MRFSVPRALPALLLSVLLTGAGVVTAAPAHADRWTYDDAAGDMTHTVETPTSTSIEAAPEQANGDITQVVVDHRRTKVVVVVRTRSRITGMFFSGVQIRTPGHRFVLMWMRVPGMGGADLIDFGSEKDPRCNGLRQRLIEEKTAIRYSVPRSCLGNPRWLRVGVNLSTTSMLTDEGYDDDGLQTGMTLTGPDGKSPKIRR